MSEDDHVDEHPDRSPQSGLRADVGAVPLPGAALDPDDRAYLMRHLVAQVLGGFRPEEWILDELDDLVMTTIDVDDDVAEVLVGELDVYVRALLAQERALEATWRDATANDLIDRAFAELPRQRIVALQNAGNTQSDCWSDAQEAAAELAGELRDADEEDERDEADDLNDEDGEDDDAYGDSEWAPVLGAVFYHSQDLARAVHGEGLYLGFGAFSERDEDPSAVDARSVAVGGIARDVLARHGVPVEWDGTVEQRLFVPPFNWRRRRWTQPPAG
ncbi:hypothetical protein OG216_44730 [Streptomycetaceae bacterium NBC_01309]